MNVRKPVNYSAMFTALDTLMAAALPQMELYAEIGRLVSGRPEKGAAVAAAEYLCGAYPDASGFSPRNLRRMREFYRTYESAPEVLAQAMTIGWTQNVVILEAELTLQERTWYIRATERFGWFKPELQRKINVNAHMEITLDFTDDVRNTEEYPSQTGRVVNEENQSYLPQGYPMRSNSQICVEDFGKEIRSGGRGSNQVCRRQHQGDQQSDLSTGPPGSRANCLNLYLRYHRNQLDCLRI